MEDSRKNDASPQTKAKTAARSLSTVSCCCREGPLIWPAAACGPFDDTETYGLFSDSSPVSLPALSRSISPVAAKMTLLIPRAAVVGIV